MNVRRLIVAVSAAALFLFARVGAAVVYSVDETQIAAFGNVDQTQVGPNVPGDGNNYCAPTATINSFTWLENAYPGFYGNSLEGGQASWAAAGTLLAGANFMQTTQTGGTSVANWITGKMNYIETYAPGTTVFQGMSSAGTGGQSWVQAANPTANFLFQMLQQGEDVEIAIFPTVGIGHVVTLSSIDWNDANNNGVFDPANGDTLSLDGVDPAGNGTTAATFDDLDLGLGAGNVLTITGGDNGAYNGYVLGAALAESPAPEPATLTLLGLGLTGLVAKFAKRRNR